MKKSYKGKVERKRKRNTFKKRIITTKQKPTIRKKYNKPKTRRRKNKNKTRKKKYKKQVYKGGGGFKIPTFHKRIMASPVGEEKNTVLYEGKTLFGTDTRQGEGKEFDFKTQLLVYSGNWNRNMRDGFGTSYHITNSGRIGHDHEIKDYEGQWKKGEKHGKGKQYSIKQNYKYSKTITPEITDNGTFYTIIVYDRNTNKQIISKEKAPEGILYEEEKDRYINMQYNGQWEDDLPNGEGTEYYENGNKKYVGKWKDGEKHGKGILYDEDGKEKYNGQWENGNKI